MDLVRVIGIISMGLLATLADEQSLDNDGKVQIAQGRLHFERLWDMLGGNQGSRGPSQSGWMDVKHVCQYGLNNLTYEVARFLLESARSPIAVLEVHDVDESMEFLTSLRSQFGNRVYHGVASKSSSCDAVVFSEAAPRFSIERILPRLQSYTMVALVSHRCLLDEEHFQTSICKFMNALWQKTALVEWGRCSGAVCMSYLPVALLHAPSLLPLDCDRLLESIGSNESASDFRQDWFLFWNFFKKNAARQPGDGVYVDVGGASPMEYNNSVFFDRCLDWKGVCVEPNPLFATYLKSYRSCQVFENCVHTKEVREKPFLYPNGSVEFVAECLPLGTILERAGLKGLRIDTLSIHAEHIELEVLESLRMQEFDIRLIIIEVPHGARWLEVDTLLLPQGYAKVAVIGRDSVYVKLQELSSGALASWPFLSDSNGKAQLPEDWAEFHQRVVDEELEQEAERKNKH